MDQPTPKQDIAVVVVVVVVVFVVIVVVVVVMSVAIAAFVLGAAPCYTDMTIKSRIWC